MTSPLLDVQGVSKHYDGFVALREVDLTVGDGEIHALIGPNGAGKSTFFGVISGELQPTQGAVRFAGADITKLPAWKRTKLGMVRSFQIVRVFQSFTVEENLRAAVLAGEERTWIFFRSERAVGAEQATRILLEELQLVEIATMKATALSQGDRKRLEIGMALALEPRILLLDEPTAGMSPVETVSTVRLIRQLWQERGCAVLITEHDMSVVFELAQRITVLHRGEVLRSGEPSAISGDPAVREVYLGMGADE